MTDFENKQEEVTNRDKFLFVLSMIPLVNIGLFFLEIERTPKLLKFLYQGVTLFWLYVIGFILLWIIWGVLASLLSLCYFVLVVYLAIKAYNGEYVEIKFLLQIIDMMFQKK